MSFNTDDTICAIATASGGAARGMVRVSGRDAVTIASRLFEVDESQPIDSLRQPGAIEGHARIKVGNSRRPLPCDLFIWPTTRSYTREPVVELHTLGSPPLLTAIAATICESGARLAEPGEFTLRAFLAGRLDLTQAEAVLGVIDARGSEDLETSLAQLSGGLARPLHRLREDLLQLLAELEAGLDFVEEDIEFISSTELKERLESAGQLLSEVDGQMTSRAVSQDRIQIALVGPPNVGKSSLFNAIVARYGCRADHQSNQHWKALVSSQRGTTRDYLTAPISLNGIECELVDTAGIEADGGGSTEIDCAAQSIAAERRQQAAIRAYCFDAQGVSDESKLLDLNRQLDPSDCTITILTKADTLTNDALPLKGLCCLSPILTSSRTGEGLDKLYAALCQLAEADELAPGGTIVASTAARCRESVRLAKSSIDRAAALVTGSQGHELIAVELRASLEELGTVVGALYTDDLLDRIFGTFCIGK